MPERVRLSRQKGYRKPDGAVVVARPSKWGNPFPVTFYGREDAVAMFREELVATIHHPWDMPHTLEFRTIAESLPDLAGRDLACWCPLDEPCHADVLLELANP